METVLIINAIVSNIEDKKKRLNSIIITEVLSVLVTDSLLFIFVF